MTQPDGLFPDVAANYASLAAWAAKSQEDWENDLREATENPFNGILQALFGDLPLIEGASFVLRLITALVRKLTGDIAALFPTVDEALDALFQIPILGPLIEYLTGIVDGTVDDLRDWLANLFDIADTVKARMDALIAGFGSNISDVVDAISGTVAAIAALISAVGGTVIGDVADAIADAVSNATTAISRIADLISGVGGLTISDVVSAISDALDNSSDALARIASLISGVGGTVIGDVVTFISNAAADASDALADVAALISGVGGTVIGDVVDFINDAGSDALTALSRIASLISGVGGTVIGDVVTAIGDGVTALARIVSLISGVSGSTISDVVTKINSATSDVATALSRIASLISGVSGSTITDVVNKINNASSDVATALSRIASLISGTGGSVITDVVTVINNAKTDVQAAVDNLHQAINGGSSTMNPVSTIKTNLQSFLNNLFGQNTLGTQLKKAAVPDVTRDMSSDLQAAIDAAVNASSGGSGQGSTPSDLLAALTNIPFDNVLIPDNPGTGGITHDATANLTTATGSSNSLTASGTLTIAATADYAIVRFSLIQALSTPALTVTVGGSAATALASKVTLLSSGQYLWSFIYGIKNPPTGASKAISVQDTSSGAVYIIAGSASSYIGVQSVSTTATTDGSASSPSHSSVASATGRLLVQMFAVTVGSSVSLSSYNKTSRSNPGSTLASAISRYLAVLAGDAAGAATVSFSATASVTTGNQWQSVAVDLIPKPSAAIGSGFRAYRAATGNVALASNQATLPNSFFDTIDTLTGDLSYSTTGNTLTVGYAGWYHVVLRLKVSTNLGSNSVVMLLYKNGSIAQYGQHFTGSLMASTTGSWLIYCNAGDTLQPGYAISASVNFNGEATGVQCYWEVCLANRSLT